MSLRGLCILAGCLLLFSAPLSTAGGRHQKSRAVPGKSKTQSKKPRLRSKRARSDARSPRRSVRRIKNPTLRRRQRATMTSRSYERLLSGQGLVGYEKIGTISSAMVRESLQGLGRASGAKVPRAAQRKRRLRTYLKAARDVSGSLEKQIDAVDPSGKEIVVFVAGTKLESLYHYLKIQGTGGARRDVRFLPVSPTLLKDTSGKADAYLREVFEPIFRSGKKVFLIDSVHSGSSVKVMTERLGRILESEGAQGGARRDSALPAIMFGGVVSGAEAPKIPAVEGVSALARSKEVAFVPVGGRKEASAFASMPRLVPGEYDAMAKGRPAPIAPRTRAEKRELRTQRAQAIEYVRELLQRGAAP